MVPPDEDDEDEAHHVVFELAASIIDALSGLVVALEDESAELVEENKLIDIWLSWAKVESRSTV